MAIGSAGGNHVGAYPEPADQEPGALITARKWRESRNRGSGRHDPALSPSTATGLGLIETAGHDVGPETSNPAVGEGGKATNPQAT